MCRYLIKHRLHADSEEPFGFKVCKYDYRMPRPAMHPLAPTLIKSTITRSGVELTIEEVTADEDGEPLVWAYDTSKWESATELLSERCVQIPLTEAEDKENLEKGCFLLHVSRSFGLKARDIRCHFSGP